MDLLLYSKKRVHAFLKQVDFLKGSEFPYNSSKTALDRIERVFKKHLRALERLSDRSDPYTAKKACTAVLAALFEYLPYLGFILRSTNVRNGFEVYGPLLQLARKVLGSSTSLILSSEWDYSPYTFFGIYSLRNFILIGLPAPESANPLLLPLAGHELGHAIWNLKLKEETRKQLQDAVEQAALSELHKNWSTYADKFPVAHIEDVGTDIECFHVLAAASQLSLRACEKIPIGEKTLDIDR